MNRFDGIIEFKAALEKTSFKSCSYARWCQSTPGPNDIHLDVTDKVKEKNWLIWATIRKWELVCFGLPFKTYIEDAVQITT